MKKPKSSSKLNSKTFIGKTLPQFFWRCEFLYRKIQNTKEFVVSEGKRINDTLIAFQSKFEHEIKVLDHKFEEQNKAIVADVNNRFDKVNKRCDQLEKMIIEEREERLKQSDEMLRPLKEHLASRLKQLFFQISTLLFFRAGPTR